MHNRFTAHQHKQCTIKSTHKIKTSRITGHNTQKKLDIIILVRKYLIINLP